MKRTVLFEIGVEELPARFIEDAEKQLRDKTATWLTDLRIPYETITVFSTPRRLAVQITDVAASQPTIEEEARGPALQIAKKDGEWTKAAIGFTRGQGKTVDDITIKTVKDTDYIFVNKVTEGQPTDSLLPSFKDVITSLAFPQQMRWGSESFTFARPIRWIVALYGDAIIPFSIAGIDSSNVTKGHRFLGADRTLTNPAMYEQDLAEEFVVVDAKKRKATILSQIQTIEANEQFDAIIDDDLIDEVASLVEYPTAFVGTYAESFLSLPSEVLITSMQEHQRYFPVQKESRLVPYFIGVRNGDDQHLANVVKGNEKVLHARLADGEFFFAEDQKTSIETNIEKLQSIVFQEKLGTVYDKVERVQTIAVEIAKALDMDETTIADVERTARISKFDLPTLMVNEFPELQGVMGEKYARLANEKEAVALGIKEHYYPLHAGGELPSTSVGAIVSVADKLDTIVGCISVGLIPTGSRDPHGLRRHAIGVLRIAISSGWEVPIESFLQIVVEQLRKQDIEITTEKDDLLQFVRMRAFYVMRELGIAQDVAEAVLTSDIGVLPYRLEKAKQLVTMRNDASAKMSQEAFTRVLTMGKQTAEATIRPDIFETASEKALYERFVEVEQSFTKADEQHDARAALESLATLAEPIAAFFEDNMVMTEDLDIRNNRLALLFAIAKLVRSYAHMDQIEWKQTF